MATANGFETTLQTSGRTDALRPPTGGGFNLPSFPQGMTTTPTGSTAPILRSPTETTGDAGLLQQLQQQRATRGAENLQAPSQQPGGGFNLGGDALQFNPQGGGVLPPPQPDPSSAFQPPQSLLQQLSAQGPLSVGGGAPLSPEQLAQHQQIRQQFPGGATGISGLQPQNGAVGVGFRQPNVPQPNIDPGRLPQGGQPQIPQQPGGLPQPGNPLVPEGGAVPLGGLGGLLERQLGNPSRFGLPQVQQAFDFLSGELQRGAQGAEQRAITDAQQRGVFFGSPLTTSLGDIATELQRGQGNLASTLALAQAQTGGQDLNAAIANAFRFGENQLGAQQFAGQLGLNALGQGQQGAPDINSILAMIQGLPTAQMGNLGGQFGGLGSLAGLLGQPSQQQQPQQQPQQQAAPPFIPPAPQILPSFLRPGPATIPQPLQPIPFNQLNQG
jgi:hypothetical protein